MTHDTVREATKKALKIAKESGALVSFDPNLRPPLWKSLDDAKVQTAYEAVNSADSYTSGSAVRVMAQDAVIELNGAEFFYKIGGLF